MMTTSFDALLDYINAKVPLNNDLKLEIKTAFQLDKYAEGDLLLKEGLPAHRIFFIASGSARTFYHHDGKDVTSWIYHEGQLITSWSSFYTQSPSYENIELTEDATTLSISHEHLQQLYQRHPKMQIFGRIIVEEQLVFLDYFYKGFLFMSAKEKYDLLMSTFPDVTQRVNLGHIASFLGISQETLSRIRRQK